MNLSDTTRDKMERAGFKIRTGTDKVLKALDKVIDGGGLLIVRVPTGYGKSTLSMFIASAIAEDPMRYGIAKVIHVLPLRSIVEDLYKKARSNAEKHVLSPLSEHDIAYQASIFLEEANKDQLFLSRLIYTTLDSYILNFTKITPLRTRWASYEAARAAIYTSLTIFDEAHLFAEVSKDGKGESRAYTSFVTAISNLLRAGLPVVVMTATVPDSLVIKIVNDALPSKCLAVTMDVSEKSLLEHYCKEEVFNDETWKSPKILTKISEKHSIDDIVEVVNSEVSKGRKVLIVRNTVRLAIRTWEELSKKLGKTTLLIHGRLSQGDKEAVINELNNAEVIVATQVIEAGVNLDADTLITDAAPLAQLVQRVGRICRDPERVDKCEGHVHILHGDNDYMKEAVVNIYDERLVEKTIKSLKEVCGDEDNKTYHCDKINWRIPNSSDASSYLKLLNDVYRDYYNELKIDYEVYDTLRRIDALVSLHRDEAEKMMVKLCGFARDDVMVPVIVRECSTYDECLKNTVVVGLEFLNHLLSRNLIYEVLRGDGETLQVKYAVIKGKDKKQLSVEDGKVSLNELISGKGNISCRKMLTIDRIIANSIKDMNKDENTEYRGFLGFMAKDDAYIDRVGFRHDR